MKSAFAAILALTAAVTVVANDFPDNMPECGVSTSAVLILYDYHMAVCSHCCP